MEAACQAEVVEVVEVDIQEEVAYNQHVSQTQLFVFISSLISALCAMFVTTA